MDKISTGAKQHLSITERMFELRQHGPLALPPVPAPTNKQ